MALPIAGINQGTQALPNRLYRDAELAQMGQPGSLPSYGSGWANACNTPWRLYKHYGHEGGISAPLIAKYRRTLAAFIEGAKTFCNRRGMVYILANNQLPLEQLVVHYLRERGLVR